MSPDVLAVENKVVTKSWEITAVYVFVKDTLPKLMDYPNYPNDAHHNHFLGFSRSMTCMLDLSPMFLYLYKGVTIPVKLVSSLHWAAPTPRASFLTP